MANPALLHFIASYFSLSLGSSQHTHFFYRYTLYLAHFKFRDEQGGIPHFSSYLQGSNRQSHNGITAIICLGYSITMTSRNLANRTLNYSPFVMKFPEPFPTEVDVSVYQILIFRRIVMK